METVRPATVADLDRLAELSRTGTNELAAQRGGRIWSVREARDRAGSAAFADALDDPRQRVVVGCVGDYVAGYAMARTEELRDRSLLGLVDDLYVEPEFRGVSVGEVMMDDLLAWCQEQGCIGVDSLALPGDRDTKNFFERFGMKARALLVHRAFGSEPAPVADDAGTLP